MERSSTEQGKRSQSAYARAVSRRRFLKAAALSGAALGVAGLGGLGLIARGNGRVDTPVAAVETTAQEQHKPPDAPEQKSAPEKETPEQEKPDKEPGKKKMGEYRTDYLYSDSPARKHNLRMSAEAVNGTVIPPGGDHSP